MADTSARPGRGPDPAIGENYVVHRMLRRELRLTAELVDGVDDGDNARAAVVAAHLRTVLDALHVHCAAEDAELWPRLRERAPRSEAVIITVQRRREAVHAFARRGRQRAGAWAGSASVARGARLIDALNDLRTELIEYLNLEEHEILPLVVRHVTAAEWRLIAGHFYRALTIGQVPIMLGMLLEDASPEERALVLGTVARRHRIVMATLGPLLHRRYVRRLHGPRRQVI